MQSSTLSEFQQLLAEHGNVARFQEFQNLMRNRIREILLVSSLYDSFTLEEDGRLSEQLLTEYVDLNLSNAPGITRVSNGSEALRMASETKRFGLILATMNIADMAAIDLAQQVRLRGLNIPVIMLAYDNRELIELMAYYDVSVFDRVFVWQGDFRILTSIIKSVEDRLNVDHDTAAVGVQSIIVIEDNINFYSSFLPLIYTELYRHTQSLIAEGVNYSHKLLRMRARPKILLCTSYEEAWEYYTKYEECVLGVISDIEFPREGQADPEAGLRFAKAVKASHFDIPILLQSDSEQLEPVAKALGASFLLKRSQTLLDQLRIFMRDNFSFGDFIFRMPDGREIGRAIDLKSLEEQLHSIPEASIKYHAERNHFSNWLKARTEFWLAHKLRPNRVEDFASLKEMRDDLTKSLGDFRRERHSGTVADFDHRTYDPESSFARIGSGSLGGKARGLGFINSMLKNFQLREHFPRTVVYVPPAVVLATGIFDQFLDQNKLRAFALSTNNDEDLVRRFHDGNLPEQAVTELWHFINLINAPLAVRSSSLLEDSKYQPFAGIYQTYMLPNAHPDPIVRLEQLLSAIKRVYASTFANRTKTYIAATPYRLEEEKMAVIVQKLVGTQFGKRFYPDFSGVARSYNFYPHPPLQASDGITAVALGFGTTVVEGGLAVRFSPKFPRHIMQFSDIEETLRFSQKEFSALELDHYDPSDHRAEFRLITCGLDIAEQDGTLHRIASVYSRENDAIYDGLSRAGARLVTFAPILKDDVFPLANILNLILEMGNWGMSSPIEIEFAVKLSVPPDKPREFAFLQMRPLVTNREYEELELDTAAPEALFCHSPSVLGNGIISDIQDIVLVSPETFRRDQTREIAEEVSQFNTALMSRHLPYLLIGLGRWGSSDPWLGIPVSWDQIAGVRVMVETGFKDFDYTPSQGSHFFQNITTARVGFFSVNQHLNEGQIDWQWLLQQRPESSSQYVTHLHFDKPLLVKMNGRLNRGIIFKPPVQ